MRLKLTGCRCDFWRVWCRRNFMFWQITLTMMRQKECGTCYKKTDWIRSSARRLFPSNMHDQKSDIDCWVTKGRREAKKINLWLFLFNLAGTLEARTMNQLHAFPCQYLINIQSARKIERKLFGGIVCCFPSHWIPNNWFYNSHFFRFVEETNALGICTMMDIEWWLCQASNSFSELNSSWFYRNWPELRSYPENVIKWMWRRNPFTSLHSLPSDSNQRRRNVINPNPREIQWEFSKHQRRSFWLILSLNSKLLITLRKSKSRR